jgi:PAS domain S-box-containing protein
MKLIKEIVLELLSLNSIKKFWKSWLFLLCGIVITIISAYYTSKDISQYLEKSFLIETEEIKTRIVLRLQAHEQILRTGAAFFEASDSVSRDEWRQFIAKSQVGTNLPGIQGIGYSIIVSPALLQKHITAVRKEGFHQYTIRPQGKRDIYTSIIYLEPFNWRNQRAFGYDMFSEPIRRTAMERARDYNIAGLSGKVILVQETGKDIQPGTLMYIPVYKKNLPITTVDEKRAAIKGWIYSPYRMNDLMAGILQNRIPHDKSEIQYEIYDGEEVSAEKLLFANRENEGATDFLSIKYSAFHKIDFYGKIWSVKFSKFTSLFTGRYSISIYLVLFGGFTASFLVFAFFVSYIDAREKTKQLYQLTSELKQSEEKFRNFVENSHVGVFQTDITGTIFYVNNAIVKMLGYSLSNEFLSAKAPLFYKDKAKRAEVVSELRTSGKVINKEIEFVTKNGDIVLMLLNAILVDDHIDGTAIDITQRKIAEEELEKKSIELQQTISEKDKFFSIISHDLKSPFQGFIGITQLMAENTKDFSISELSNFSSELNNRARNLFKLLQNLLEWARVQQGAISFEPEIISLKEIVEVNVETLKQFSENKSIAIVNETDATCKVFADKNMINSVCQNLLSNAIKFTKRSGKIFVTSKDTGNNFIEISVVDSGIGMSPEILSKLFKIEERVGEAGTEGEESTGLGLLLCKEFVEKNGGSIWVESVEGNGSKFSFTLPKAL